MLRRVTFHPIVKLSKFIFNTTQQFKKHDAHPKRRESELEMNPTPWLAVEKKNGSVNIEPVSTISIQILINI